MTAKISRLIFVILFLILIVLTLYLGYGFLFEGSAEYRGTFVFAERGDKIDGYLH